LSGQISSTDMQPVSANIQSQETRGALSCSAVANLTEFQKISEKKAP